MSSGMREADRRVGPANTPERLKAGPLQVAATIFFALIAIGKKGTWHKDGVTVSLPQIVIGAIVALVVVLVVLIMIVQLAIK
jgi:hypothetical protein